MTENNNVPDLDKNLVPIWQMDQALLQELAWLGKVPGGFGSKPPELVTVLTRMVINNLRLNEYLRKVYGKQIASPTPPEVEEELGELEGIDRFGRQTLLDVYHANKTVETARQAAGAEKRAILLQNSDPRGWPAKLPELQLKYTDLQEPNQVLGQMIDDMVIADYLIGLGYQEVQSKIAVKWPWRFCADCGEDDCVCGEIKVREKTGEHLVKVIADDWQAENQSYLGLMLQMVYQYHWKNLARGLYYELHRTTMEPVELLLWGVDLQTGALRPEIDHEEVLTEAADTRIWAAVKSCALQINLYKFISQRLEEMKSRRRREQNNCRLSGGTHWSFNPEMGKWLSKDMGGNVLFSGNRADL